MIKLLVSIPNYGDQNLKYLDTVVDEYRSYKNYDVTINVHSTVPIPRNDINVIQYDPFTVSTLLYKHRQEFVDKKDDYDLFLAADNDVLIKEDAIDVYLKHDKILPANHCLGFIAYEMYPGNENLYFFHLWPTVYHQPAKFNTEDRMTGTSYLTSKEMCIEGNWYFMLTSACQQSYLLTKEKLNIAINTSGYLKSDWPVAPKETAYAGIWTNWCHADGVLYKVHTRNVEDLQKCLIHHLPNLHTGIYNSKSSVADALANMVTWNTLKADLNL
jgi:hypothetical protein